MAAAQLGRNRPTDWRLLGVVGLLSAAFCGAFVLLRPDLVFTADFLIHDQGVHLLLARTLERGGRLYRDFGYPYGPVPAHLLGAWTHLFGASARSYVALIAVVNTAFLILATHALRRHLARSMTLAVMLLGIMPLTLTPGSVAGGYTNNTYIGLERCLLIGLVLAWVPPRDRTWRESVRAGALFGVWQFVKFGGAVFGIGAWLCLDVLSLWPRFGAGRHVARNGVILVGVAGAFEMVRWAALFAFEPYALAWDTAWPAYAAQLYATLSPDERWPWPSMIEFATQWALPAGGLLLSAVGAFWILRSREAMEPVRLALLLPSAFLLLAALGYLGHSHTVRQYAWCAVPGAALLLARHRWARTLRALAVAVALPAVAVMVKVALINPVDPNMRPVTMVNGDRLWLSDTDAASATHVLARLSRSAAEEHSAPLILPTAGGLYFYAGVQPPTRNVWLLPSYVRPYDVDRLRIHISTATSLLIINRSFVDRGHVDSALRHTLGDLVPSGYELQELSPGWWNVVLPRARS